MSAGVGSVFPSPRAIFVVVFVLQLVDGLLGILRKKASRSTEQVQLRQEINQLLKEASSLSTPSTFAQAAKLRRVAAAKEKELAKFEAGSLKEKTWPYNLSGRILNAAKVLLYLGLSWHFWGVPVVVVPQNILQPFGRIISWSHADSSTGLLPIGIIPWLILTSQVSSLLSQKLLKCLKV